MVALSDGLRQYLAKDLRGHKVSESADRVLGEAADEYLEALFDKAKDAAGHRGSKTVKLCDFKLVMQVAGIRLDAGVSKKIVKELQRKIKRK